MMRLVAVSNRMPFEDGGAVPGGLAVALDATLRQRGGLWFGWSGIVTDVPARVPRMREAGNVSYAALDLARDEHSGFYLGFSNGVLWPLCHGFGHLPVQVAAHYGTYRKVNRRYADALLPLLRPDDLVWVHDYHLLPFGQMLRDAGAEQALGFFLHVPFPELSALRKLPCSASLLRTLLAYDALGFQTADDLAAFRRAAQWQWGSAALQADGSLRVDRRRVNLGVYPIGVDVEEIQREVRAVQHSPMVAAASAMREGGTVFIAADRLLKSKGLEERYRAYEAYLELPESTRQRACLLQVIARAHNEMPAAAKLAASLETLTARINARHARPDWTPFRQLNRSFAHDVLMGLLHAARVGIVTPLRDGMNLVAKEFVAAQDPADPGVLVLSAFAGAARELDGAIQVDPRDTVATAEAIRHACSMPLQERRERHDGMIAVLRRNDLRAWHTGFLQRLQACRA